MSTLTAKIQLRRDTSANWASNNPILAAGEVAFTSDVFYSGTDQQRFKIGDGVQTWSQLDYVPEGAGGSSFPEHLYLTVVNKSADNLLASGYKVMRVSDAQGQRLAVDYAQADSDANSTDTIGVVYENINKNQEGKLIVIGELTGLNTTGSLQSETWADGDVIYLSPTTAGNITNIKPTAPNHLVTLGYVVYSHANQGKIYIKCDNGYELQELHNVYAPSPFNNDGIFWSSGTTRYENKSIATALGYTPENLANKGIANGYTPLGNDTKVDAAYLPSYVSDILEYANLAAFPATGTSGKIYLALDTNKVYRWSGSVYIEVAANSGVWGAITGTITNQTDLVNFIKGYALNLRTTALFNPADATLYFIGQESQPFTTASVLPLYIPKSGTIKNILISSRCANGTSENSTFILFINDVSNATLTSSYKFNTLNSFINYSVAINVNANDYLYVRWQTPTWATNPTQVRFNIIFYIE